MTFFRRFVASILCVAVLNLGSPLVAQAGVIGTLQAVESQNRAADLATVNTALAARNLQVARVKLALLPNLPLQTSTSAQTAQQQLQAQQQSTQQQNSQPQQNQPQQQGQPQTGTLANQQIPPGL